MAAMKVTKQVYKVVPVDSLTIHPANPRRGNVVAIKESIEANGFYGAVIFQKSTGYVMSGNHRLQAAQQSGAKEIPAIAVDCDDDAALRILLADNRTNDLAYYDNDGLAEILRGLADTGDATTGTGYSLDDFDDIIAGFQESSPLPNFDANTKQESNLQEAHDRWKVASTRSVMLEYTLDRFRWIVEGLGNLRDEYQVGNSAEVVMRLVEEARGEKCPDE